MSDPTNDENELRDLELSDDDAEQVAGGKAQDIKWGAVDFKRQGDGG